MNGVTAALARVPWYIWIGIALSSYAIFQQSQNAKAALNTGKTSVVVGTPFDILRSNVARVIK